MRARLAEKGLKPAPEEDRARYGDTSGYHHDSLRDMWLWRDWVIHAFNANQPINEFTIEQIAGDLLPNATVPQHVAGGVRGTGSTRS